MTDNHTAPGLTPKSFMACLLGMLAMGMLIQYSDIAINVSFASEHTLALPAMWVFAVFSGLSGLLFLLTRWRLLTRAEMLCVLFCMLISAPLMTQGFWHRFVAIVSTNPRAPDFEKLDAMNDRLWPHGPNLIGASFDAANPDLQADGDCRWEEIEYDAGKRARLPVLVNTNGAASSFIRIRLPVRHDGGPGVVPAEPYVVSVLARATELGPTAHYTCRVYTDDAAEFTEFFSSAASPKVNFLHRTGFRRAGAYGVKFPADARTRYTLEFGLVGNGRLELASPKLFNVASLESVFKGRVLVSEREYAAMSASERVGTVVKPDRMWSLHGAAFLLSWYIPVRDWAGPVLVWTAFVLLILSAVLAVNIIMRRQWLDNERFQLPSAQIAAALLGEEGDERRRALPSIWTNRLMLAGFVVAFLWLLLKVWHFYNPNVPDLTVKVYLSEYFRDPSWGKMWEHWRFEIEGIFLAMCIFMELNVLLSIVIGYALYRCQFWIGEVTNLTVDPSYPYSDAQGIGAYLGYAAILLVLSRKYLWRTLQAAFRGDRAAAAGEALSYRGAYVLLIAATAGSALWARGLGIASGSMLVFFAFLVTIGLVASRLRAECGTPWGYFVPWSIALFMGLLGGVWRFGPEAMMFCYIAGFMLGETVFFLIPGAQMELLGLGRRWNVTPRHLVWCVLLGVLGGMLIGGWVFLSNAYAVGGDTIRYQWPFDAKAWYFFPYNVDLTAANNRMLGQTVAAAGAPDHAWLAFGSSAAIAVALTALRQFFAGFWFHPVGFILSSTSFMNYVWGSALTAWVVRSIVLRFGGAATVRNKLQPFFVGVFLGTCAGYLFVLIQSAYLHSTGVDMVYPILTPW